MTYPNTDETLHLMKEILSIPSPSGNTNEVIAYIERFLKKLDVDTYRNRKGGLIATLPGKDDSHHRMLTAHVDTLGAIVKEIKRCGRLKLDLIGGFKYNSIEGEYCQIETSTGKKLLEPFLCTKQAFTFTRMPVKQRETKKTWKSALMSL